MAPGGPQKFTALFLTLVASASLYYLGYLSGQDADNELMETQQRIVQAEADRMGRIQAANISLEERLSRLQAELDTCQKANQAAQAAKPPAAPPPPANRAEIGGRTLQEGRAQVLLEGALVLTLQEVRAEPRRALIQVQADQGQPQRVLVKPGSDLPVSAAGQDWRLVVKAIRGSSLQYSLLQAP